VNSMNKSSLPSPSAQSTLPLRSLQEMLDNRIIQKKREIHPSHNKVYLEILWTEIETAMGVSRNTYATTTTIISQYLNGLFVFYDHTFIKK
jgi:hypothetical protein